MQHKLLRVLRLPEPQQAGDAFRLGAEWLQQLEEYEAQRVDVHLVTVRTAQQLFRGHVEVGTWVGGCSY